MLHGCNIGMCCSLHSVFQSYILPGFRYLLIFSCIIFSSSITLADRLIFDHKFEDDISGTLDGVSIENISVDELNGSQWIADNNSYQSDGSGSSSWVCDLIIFVCEWKYDDGSAVIDIKNILTAFHDNDLGVFEIQFNQSRPKDLRAQNAPDGLGCGLFNGRCSEPRNQAWATMGFFSANSLDIDQAVDDSDNRAAGTIVWHQNRNIEIHHDSNANDIKYSTTDNGVDDEIFTLKIDTSDYSNNGYAISFYKGSNRVKMGQDLTVNDVIQYIALTRGNNAWTTTSRLKMVQYDEVNPVINLEENSTTIFTDTVLNIEDNITAEDIDFDGTSKNIINNVEYFRFDGNNYQPFDISSFNTATQQDYDLKIIAFDDSNNYSLPVYWQIKIIDATIAESAIDKIISFGDGSQITYFELSEISRVFGAEEVDIDYLTEYQTAISNTPLMGVDKVAEVLALMDSVISIIEIMKAASVKDASSISFEDIKKSIDQQNTSFNPPRDPIIENLEIYRNFIELLSPENLNSWIKIQTLIESGNNFSAIHKYADDESNELSFDQLQSLELVNLSNLNLKYFNYYKTLISSVSPSDLQTLDQLQSLINQGNARGASDDAVLAIVSANQLGDGSMISFEDLNAVLGAEVIDATYIPTYQAAISHTPLSGANNENAVLTLLDSIFNIVAIMKAAEAGNVNLINILILEKAILPSLAVDPGNLSLYRQFIEQVAPSSIQSRFDIESIIVAANSFLAIQNFSLDSENNTLSSIQLESLQIMGLENLHSMYFDDYLNQITAVTPTSIQTIADLQILINKGNKAGEAAVASSMAVTKISAANQTGNGASITLEDFNAVLGAAVVELDYLPLYQEAVDNIPLDTLPGSDDISRILLLMDSSQMMVLVIDAANTSDASQIDTDVLSKILGLQGVDQQFIVEYRLAIEQSNSADVSSVSSLNMLINLVNFQASFDNDLDGINNFIDDDDDSDRLADELDPNDQLRDSDFDGIDDGADADVNGDGLLDNGATDINGNGIRDVADAILLAGRDSLADLDNDGILDAYDSDSDNDQVITDRDMDDLVRDFDGDTVIDGLDADMDGDGVIDNGPDSDNDGITDFADADFYSDCSGMDMDGDGVMDAMANDIDGDGLADFQDPDNQNKDVDNDGLLDGIDVDYDGDNQIDQGIDGDFDGLMDCADSDLDNDGVVDQGSDFDGDGIRDLFDRDDDGDGIEDILDSDPYNIDHDQDGIANKVDVDIDGDGLADNGMDGDNDGVRDLAVDLSQIDADLDGDGKIDSGVIDFAGDGVADGNLLSILSDSSWVGNHVEVIQRVLESPDIDIDNDDILNIAEADRNRDGRLDDLDDDGIPDVFDGDNSGAMADGSGDSDQDGVSDAKECPSFPSCDYNDNGILDYLGDGPVVPDSKEITVPSGPSNPTEVTSNTNRSSGGSLAIEYIAFVLFLQLMVGRLWRRSIKHL